MARRGASLTVVVDASIAAAWLLPDEGDDATDRVLDRVDASYGLAPSIFRHEIRNILLVSERRQRIAAPTADALLSRLSKLPILDEGAGDDAEVLRLARKHGLTTYDAAYLALALSTGSPLSTLDHQLASAARTCGVTILGPLAP